MPDKMLCGITNKHGYLPWKLSDPTPYVRTNRFGIHRLVDENLRPSLDETHPTAPVESLFGGMVRVRLMMVVDAFEVHRPPDFVQSLVGGFLRPFLMDDVSRQMNGHLPLESGLQPVVGSASSFCSSSGCSD